MRSLLAEALICSLDKHIGGPETGGGAPTWIVVARRFGCYDLIERHAFLLHVENPVANNGHHVTVVSHVGGVTEPPVAWDYISSRFFIGRRDHYFENLVQSVDFTLDAAAVSQIDDR